MIEAGQFSRVDKVASERRAISGSAVLVGALLLLTMLVGGYFRFTGLNWDDYVHFHPDERFLTTVATSIGRPLSPAFLTNPTAEQNEAQYARCLERYPDDNGRGGFFDAECSTLNPNNIGHGLFVYGTLPLFIARWAAEIAVEVTGDPVWVGYDGIHLIWRLTSAIADMFVIAVVFAIGHRLHGKWVGLIAAILYTCSVFAIQQAHFGTADAMTNLFIALALWFAIRAQYTGSLAEYVLFGAAFGAALASRINTAPLVGVIVLAALVRALPAFDDRLPSGERRRILTGAVVGLVLAGVFTFVFFRVFNPYAFMGPGFFGLRPNPAWLEDIAEAQHLVSGRAEMPPNWQWVGRTPYLFPLANMVLWGMGAPLGCAGLLALVWAVYRLVRGHPGASANLILAAWVIAYFILLGGQWVMTMRYYLPLYAPLAVLAAWGMVELLRKSRGRVIARSLSALVLIVVVGGTGLWAAMFTNIYRNPFTGVQASMWIWENVPGDFAMEIEGAGENTPLVNIALFNTPGAADLDLLAQATRLNDGQLQYQDFVAPASGTITSVYAPHLGDPLDDPEPERLQVSLFGSGLTEVLAFATLEANLSRDNHPLGDAYTIELNRPVEVVEGETYTFVVEVLEGGPVVSGGSVFSWEGDWDEVVPVKICTLPPGVTLADNPPPGLVSAADCNGRDAWTGLITGFKQQIIYADVPSKRDRLQQTLDESDYIIIGTNRRYDSQSRIPGKWPMTLRYYDALFSGELGYELAATFQETFELGPLKVSDQYLPTYDAPEWLNEFEAEEAFHVYDHPVMFIFRKTDAYDPENTRAILNSVSINPIGLVNFSCPEAEDYPIINFYCDPNLAGVYPLSAPGMDVSMSADQAPTALQFPDQMRETQYSGGAWNERFDTDSLLNTNHVLAVIIWWLTIVIFGWAAWPLLFVALPGLSDRGYGFAKFTGMFVVAWLAWVLASARIPAWSQTGILLALIGFAVASGVIAWRSQATIGMYIQMYWRRLLGIEAITLLLFVAFLSVRLTNPDLWHPAYGGEKPMDFAYFNGVLRSTVFPPIDPWFADGYINYYYFGYVIVGAPVLLLGVVPSVAYNLVIPTLFGLTGIAAFSVAFNMASAWRSRRAAEEIPDDELHPPRPLGNPWVAGIAALLLTVVLGNLDTPRIIFAELGEIGGYRQPQTLEMFLLQRYREASGHEPDASAFAELAEMARDVPLADRLNYELSNMGEAIASVLRGIGRVISGEAAFSVSPDRWFWGPTRVLAEPPVNSGGAITELPYFTFLYGDLHAHMIAMPLQLFAMSFLLSETILAGRLRRSALEAGLSIVLGGLAVGMLRATNTWDWATFMVLSVAGLSYVWWLRWAGTSRAEGRSGLGQMIAIAVSLGLLVAGIVAYVVQGAFAGLAAILFVAGIGFFFVWLFWNPLSERLNRWSVVDFVLWVGGFVAVSFLVALPYTSWYAATYSRVLPWEGNRTPIWAYVDIHGLFLFLIVSLLVWDTARWLRSTYVRSLRGTSRLLGMASMVIVLLVAAAVVLTLQGYQVTLIVVPLLVWITILFFRAGQTRMMQFALALAGLALGLTLAVEYVVLDGDIGRQNTVFKFYIQVWLLFGVTGGAAFAWLISGYGRWPGAVRGFWTFALAVLVFVAALYPFMATPGKAVFRMAPHMPLTLDGMAYMQYASQYEGTPQVIATTTPPAAPFSLADDYNVIRWLQENVEGTPVIMEGRSEREYLWGSRISIYTGLPSVVGWNFHQRQQRTFNPLPRLVEQRIANVNAFYMTLDIPTAWDILRHYDVSYVIVSGLERAYYPPENLAKFDQMVEMGLLDVAYQEGNATIYRVNKDARLEQVTERAGLDAS
ncbi:MAG: DUF2298 domain-containing protein [Chloroflexota bacterium]|nr:MAG: hypothetical protein DIU68_05795 [Chloroflexota bacterium]